MSGNQCDQFFIGLAVYWWGFELSQPHASADFFEHAASGIGFNLDLNAALGR